MNEIAKRIQERVGAISQRLTTSQKVTYGILAVVLIGAIATLAFMGSQPEFRTLYANLEEGQAGRIVESLEERKEVYQLTGAGTTIQVPAERVHELRIALASAGVAGGTGVGYELIDKNEMFGMPDDVIQLNKQRMLEGELARSIATLSEVRSARVHLAVPKETLFVEDQRPATASVIVDLDGQASLNKRQVQGIINLVAGAVPRLDADNVSVVDQRGKVLNRQHGDMADGSSALEYKEEVERRLERKAAEVLEPIVGVGRLVVRVQAEIDFSREQRTEELYNPEKTVVVRSETLNEARENGGNRVGGAAGAAPNDPNLAQGVVRVGDASSATREKLLEDSVADKVVKQVVGPSARLGRLSVAVVVDGKYVPVEVPEGEEVPEGGPGDEYKARSPAEMKNIERLVAKAVGLNAERGDDLEVSNVQFVKEEAGSAVPELSIWQWLQKEWRTVLKWLVIVVLGLLLILRVFAPMVRHLTYEPEAAEVLEEGVLPPGEDQLALPGEEELKALEQREASVLERVREFARENPDQAAAVMRFWLKRKMNQEAA